VVTVSRWSLIVDTSTGASITYAMPCHPPDAWRHDALLRALWHERDPGATFRRIDPASGAPVASIVRPLTAP